MASALVAIGKKPDVSSGQSSQTIFRSEAANELVFAIVGHVGSGTSELAKLLKGALSRSDLPKGPFDTTILKASDELRRMDGAEEKLKDAKHGTLAYAERMQDLGDSVRKGDHAAVARALILSIRQLRATKLGVDAQEGDAVTPDGTRRAYIIDSIRHPAEIELLRSVYQSAFVLIGIVCEDEVRLQRLNSKYEDAGNANARAFMDRDANKYSEKFGEPEKHGQQVSKAFHLADVFLDNSASRKKPDDKPSEYWTIPDALNRLVKIVTHAEVVRPTLAETAMHAAYGAQIRSACLSRQVGAALMDPRGNLIATGTNEVPRAGGGVYGEDFELDEENDHRCAYDQRYCSSTKQQNELIDEVVEELVANSATTLEKSALAAMLRRSRLRQLLEFSRAVHAEMDALLRAGREGTSTIGTRMFVTTYPCHYCARHIVAAGVDEVQYIEPYSKSRATTLHADAITTDSIGWTAPSQADPSGHKKVLFRAFVGVAPRLYKRAFLKDRDLKDDATGEMKISDPDWATQWHIGRVSYVELEALLAKSTKPKPSVPPAPPMNQNDKKPADGS